MKRKTLRSSKKFPSCIVSLIRFRQSTDRMLKYVPKKILSRDQVDAPPFSRNQRVEKKANERESVDVMWVWETCGWSVWKVWVKYFRYILSRSFSHSQNFFTTFLHETFIVKLSSPSSSFAVSSMFPCIDTSTKSDLVVWKVNFIELEKRNYFSPHHSETSDQNLVVNCSSLSFSLFRLFPLCYIFFSLFHPDSFSLFGFPPSHADIFDSIQPNEKKPQNKFKFHNLVYIFQFDVVRKKGKKKLQLRFFFLLLDSLLPWKYLQF